MRMRARWNSMVCGSHLCVLFGKRRDLRKRETRRRESNYFVATPCLDAGREADLKFHSAPLFRTSDSFLFLLHAEFTTDRRDRCRYNFDIDKKANINKNISQYVRINVQITFSHFMHVISKSRLLPKLYRSRPRHTGREGGREGGGR